ncbi:MAG: Hpt domain-containing protein [Saprospiraceae bacterium]|nr:Hpt domain-containing protein [Saprospiraceae bacterium]
MELTLDLTYLNQISGGDKEFINDILKTFLEEMPKDIKKIKEGLNNNNNALIGKMAHKSKATLHLLGLEELKNFALNIEQTIKKDSKHPEIHNWSKQFISYIEKVYPNIENLL